MGKIRDPQELAANYHHALPKRVREYLNGRGIPDEVIDFYTLGWNGWRIMIPVHNIDGKVVFFKLAKGPDNKEGGPKMMASKGSYVELYGWNQIKSKPRRLIICEGEFDRLVLEARGFEAVTSTGGATTFKNEWGTYFKHIPEIYTCFDRDGAGMRGEVAVRRVVPHVKKILLPGEVGRGGDVTDFFVRLKRTEEDLEELIENARPIPEPLPRFPKSGIRGFRRSKNQRANRIKSRVSIEEVVRRYVKLRQTGDNYTGLCPFHNDHNPSLVVYPETATFHCFGCRKHGDVISFLMEIEKLGFKEALDVLDRFHSSHEQRDQKTRKAS